MNYDATTAQQDAKQRAIDAHGNAVTSVDNALIVKGEAENLQSESETAVSNALSHKQAAEAAEIAANQAVSSI